MKDIVDAHNDGRVHLQRFIKTGGNVTGDGQWQDWSYMSGQPAYDPRIGSIGTFTPFVASKNDAIYFPPIPLGMERRISFINLVTPSGNIGQERTECFLYDLLGVYPLLDGDSTDLQELNNTLSLSRYADGKGVQMLIVNHISPSANPATATIGYTDSNDIDRSISVAITPNGVPKIATAQTTSSVFGFPFVPLASQGVKRVNNFQLNTSAGGLFAVYLIKPFVNMCEKSGLNGFGIRLATERHLTFQNAFSMPKIEDGAWLGWFAMPFAASRSVPVIFGNIEFVWG